MSSMAMSRHMRLRPAICVGAQASGIRPSMNVGNCSPHIHECMQPIDVPMTSRK